MSEAAAYYPPAAVPEEGGGERCEVCGKPGRARVCGCDGVDRICHLSDCETVCAKCAIRAKAQQVASSPHKPEDRQVQQPCVLEAQKGCQTRKLDVEAAGNAYAVLGIGRHSKDSFAADVLLGHFENVRLEGEVKLGNQDLDDLRHKSRCWTCWPPQPRMSAQWCAHPRELWKLLEKHPKALTRPQLVAQIDAIEKKQEALLSAMPAAARELIGRRLRHLVDIGQELAKEQDHG